MIRHLPSLTKTVHAPGNVSYAMWWRHDLGPRWLCFRLTVYQTSGSKVEDLEWQCHMEIAHTRPLASEDRVLIVSTGPTRHRAFHDLRRKLNLFAFAAPRFRAAGKLKRMRKGLG